MIRQMKSGSLKVLDLCRTLEPFRAIVRERPFLSGDRAMYADYILFGAFQWARCISPLPSSQRWRSRRGMARPDASSSRRDRSEGDGLSGLK
jgi:glutathione S-transferase